MRALAEERCHAVMAGGTCVAGRVSTVVDVLAAVITRPTVHAHAVVPALGIDARATVLAGVGHQCTLFNVDIAKLTCGTRIIRKGRKKLMSTM